MMDSLIIAEDAHRKYLLEYYEKQKIEISKLIISMELDACEHGLKENEVLNLNERIDAAKVRVNELLNVLLMKGNI